MRQVWTGLTYNRDDYEKEHGIADRTYSKEYGAFFVSWVIVIFALLVSVASGSARQASGATTAICWPQAYRPGNTSAATASTTSATTRAGSTLSTSES